MKLPDAFHHIVQNDAARAALRDRACAGLMTQADWLQLAELVKDRKNLRRGAEQALRWNTDKGLSA